VGKQQSVSEKVFSQLTHVRHYDKPTKYLVGKYPKFSHMLCFEHPVQSFYHMYHTLRMVGHSLYSSLLQEEDLVAEFDKSLNAKMIGWIFQ